MAGYCAGGVVFGGQQGRVIGRHGVRVVEHAEGLRATGLLLIVMVGRRQISSQPDQRVHVDRRGLGLPREFDRLESDEGLAAGLVAPRLEVAEDQPAGLPERRCGREVFDGGIGADGPAGEGQGEAGFRGFRGVGSGFLEGLDAGTGGVGGVGQVAQDFDEGGVQALAIVGDQGVEGLLESLGQGSVLGGPRPREIELPADAGEHVGRDALGREGPEPREGLFRLAGGATRLDLREHLA